MQDWIQQYPVPDETVVVEYEGKGCMDTLYEEYDPDAVYEAPGSCRTLAVSRAPQGPEAMTAALWGDGTRKATIFNIAGRIVREYDAEHTEKIWDYRDNRGNMVEPGVYLVSVIGTGVYKKIVLKH